MRDDITGVILTNDEIMINGSVNSLLMFDDQTLIERTADILKQVFERIIIVDDNPKRFDFLNEEIVQTVYPGYGPLSGIHTALFHSKSKKIFVVSCNLPFLQSSIIKFLCGINSEEQIILPKTVDRIEYSCGIYGISLLPITEKILGALKEAQSKNGEVKSSASSLWNFAERIGAELVDIEFERFYFNDLFFSICSEEDYQYAKEKVI